MSYWKPGNDKPSESRNGSFNIDKSANDENGCRATTSSAENTNNQGITLSKSVLSMKVSHSQTQI